MKKDSKNGGRPTKLTSATVKKLELAFKSGLSVAEACSYADISRQSYYNYAESTPGFLTKVASWKSLTKVSAQINISQSIIKDKDLGTSIWYVEHQDKLATLKEQRKKIKADARKANAEASIAETQAKAISEAEQAKDRTLIVDDVKETDDD